MARSIALVGCGALARQFYLPALISQRREFDRVWLIDRDESARREFAATVGGESVADLSDVPGSVSFVVIATPSETHFPIAKAALSQDAHVLIEKPFVVWPAHGRELADIATARGRIIAVNQTRRFFPYAKDLRTRVGNGEFGQLRSVVHREGSKFAWPFRTGSAFGKGAQRSGVIMDIGVHVLDFYHYILQPEWALNSSTHDGFDGPEGLARIDLLADEAPVEIRLSRYVAQDNTACLTFSDATIRLNVHEPARYSYEDRSGARTEFAAPHSHAGPNTIAEELLLNFVAAGEGGGKAVCDAASALPVIELLDEIYQRSDKFSSALGAT